MIITIILAILAVIGLGLLVMVVKKKLPLLRVVNPDTSIESRTRRKKNELLRKRIERTGEQYAKVISTKTISPVSRAIQNMFRTVAGKLTAAERAYQEKQKIGDRNPSDPSVIAEFLQDAEDLFKQELYDRAEKKLIDIIGIDQKNVPAYELLGRLYFARKDLDLAEETFSFLVKLAKEDASVQAYMGEVLSAQNKHEDAYTYFEKAITLSPKNPKYLDFYIQSAIRLMKKHEAITALERLRQVNPDNKKIEDFEKQIDKLPTVKVRK